jgi:hypothetical protein
MMEGVKSTMIYCKNFYKCHNVPPAQQYDKKKINKHKILTFKEQVIQSTNGQMSRTDAFFKKVQLVNKHVRKC